MAKTRKQEFDVLDWGKDQSGLPLRFLQVDSERLEECMKHYQQAKLDGIYISPYHGYRRKDLAFLKGYPFVTRVVVAYSPTIQVSDLCSLPTLRSIAIADNKEPIDFSVFPILEDLSIDWHSKMTFPRGSKAMKRLRIRNYKPKSKDLTELPDFVNLEELEIVQSPLRSLAGLGRFKRLKFLELCYLSKLERIAELDAYSVEELRFDVCRKISDHEHVVRFPKLWKLMLTDCGTVPSLKFLDKMPRLRWLSFVDTNVLDGDMTPCFRLEYTGTLNKKHYSHTDAQIHAIIAERQKKGTARE